MHHYIAYQLNIDSELPLPELISCSSADVEQPDVMIQYGKICSKGLEQATVIGPNFQLRPNSFWLQIPNVARFLVQNGCQIVIDAVPGVDEASLRLFVHGHCFSSLLIQRNLFVLQGTTILIHGKAILFLADVGVGKSTFTATCLNRGHLLIADDLCAMDLQGNILPGQPHIHLWPDALKYLNINRQRLTRLRPHVEKYALPIHQQFYAQACPVSAIYILSTHPFNEIKRLPVQGVEKIHHLQRYIFHRKFLSGLGKESLYLNQAIHFAQKIPMTHLDRPLHGFHTEAMLDLVEHHLREKMPV